MNTLIGDCAMWESNLRERNAADDVAQVLRICVGNEVRKLYGDVPNEAIPSKIADLLHRLATVHQFKPRPKWHKRASRFEIKEIEDIDRQMADLRRRRQKIINRVHMRTDVWAAHHPERKRA